LFALEGDGLGAMPATYIGGTDVADGIRWVGLDVHSRESTIVVFDQGTGELTTRRVVGRPHELLEPEGAAVVTPLERRRSGSG